MIDYKKKYLKYKKKYLQIKKFSGGADQIYDTLVNTFFLENETREEALRKEEMKRQEKYGVIVKGTNADIEQANEGIINLTILEEIKKKQENEDRKPAVLKWSNLAIKPENVFNNIEDCQKEVERLQELLTEKELNVEQLTPSTKKI